MTPNRQALITALLRRCFTAYQDGLGDIPSWGNTVETYLNPNNQLKYVHMYCAKYIGCWRWIRKAMATPADGPVWSIGAGPCLCLMGWFFDNTPTTMQDVVSMDLAPWSELLQLPEFGALFYDIFKDARSVRFEHPRFFPDQLPPQGVVAPLIGARPISPTDIPADATVLLPMVLNHVLGATQPHPQPGLVFSWLRAVAGTVRRVIVVDMPHDRTSEFWSNLWRGLGLVAPPQPVTFNFASYAKEFSSCYDGESSLLRTGLRYPQFCNLSGMIHTRGVGWQYFHNN